MPKKFLLADDDPDDSELFCEALSRLNPRPQFFAVGNGLALFDLLDQKDFERPDVIFLDINMPTMNGWDCLRKLKAISDYRDIPTIMYSTSSTKKDIELAYRLGAILFLTKPEDFRELCKILEVVATSSPESLVSRLKGFRSVKLN